ncbi:MAG: hypothetical protein Q9179_004620 [Wetmoreana sp. 5 TL-2023]
MQLFLANPDTIEDVFLRRKDFPKPVHMYKMLEIFGRNVNTVEGQDWVRHRKLTAPPFNERNSNIVWTESIQQARGMLDWWKDYGSNGVRTTAKDAKILSLNVLISAGFGMSYPFASGRDPPTQGFTMSYQEALSLVLEYTLVIVALPKVLLRLPFIPEAWVRAGQATIGFQRHIAKMVDKERSLISQGVSGAASLTSLLVRGSEEARRKKAHTDQEGNAPNGLTDEEIYGNIFLFNFAGHETTANILTYSILLLAAHPQWQDWLSEEVEHVFGGEHGGQAWTYDKFPKLKRCLAVMLETLRLYNPVVAVPKYTDDRAQTIYIDGSAYVIPPKTLVMLNICAMHTNPRYWGEDSLNWRPSRWITTSLCDQKSGPQEPIEQETLFEPRKGTYLPWSGGARVCVGKKFSQVEFVAVMAVLFQKHRVEPVMETGESVEKARRRVVGVIEDSLLRMTLQVRDPTLAAISWKKR